MSDDSGSPEPHETLTFTGEIDRLCERFETAWKSGKPPNISDYLDTESSSEKSPPVSELLAELVRIDIDYRWRFADHGTGDQETPGVSSALPTRPRLEDYTACHPPLGSLKEISETLIAAEYRSRHRWGDKPSHNEYVERFGSRRGTLIELLSGIDEELALRKRREDNDLTAHTPTHETPEGLHVRCPHCRNPIEIVDDTPVAEINCPSCGSSFNLVGEEALTLQTLGGTRRRRRTIGHFELIEQLGYGAFGAVWKARDTQLDRIVAVKTPRKGQLFREETEKVLREARAAAQLRHPNIVSVHEVGLDGNLLYTVCDFVEGVTLHDWLTGQRFSHRETAELCAKVADAIHFAHEQGVIHRDLKPSNIMLDPSGEPHIMDFGLAKREAGEITMTMDGQILGTPAYMSPEQAKGKGHEADRRTDVYSLGVILFELLTGECPFRGSVRMLIKQIVEDEPTKPRRLNSHVPRDLDTICLKCLNKDRNRRYATAEDLGNDLDRYLRGEPIQARPVGQIEQAWRWCARNRIVAGLGVAVAVALLLGTVISSYFAIEAGRRADEAQDNLTLARQETQRATAATQAEAEARRKESEARLSLQDSLAISYLRRGQGLCEQGKVERGLLWFAQSLETARPEALDIQRTIRANISSWSLQLCTMEQFVVHSGAVLDVQLSGDGKTIITAAADEHVRFWDAGTGKPLGAPLVHGSAVESMALNPDGRTLASGGRDGVIKLWDIETREEKTPPIQCPKGVHDLAFSPGGDALLVALWERSSALHVTLPAGQQQELPLEHHGPVTAVAWHPGGNALATAGDDGTVRICRADTFEAIHPPLIHATAVRAIAFSPQGEHLLTGCKDGTAQLWNVRDAAKNGRPFEHPAEVESIAFSPDGSLVVTGCFDKFARLWDVRTGDRCGSLVQHQFDVESVCFSATGVTFVTGAHDDTARLWKVPLIDRLESREFRHESPVADLAFSPDGKFLVTVCDDKTAHVWKAATGEPVVKPLVHSDRVTSVDISNDGSLMLTGSWDGSLWLWNLVTGQPRHEPLMHHDQNGKPAIVRAVCFSPDGRHFGSAGRDGTVQIWDLVGWRNTGLVLTHEQQVMDLAYSPDGRHLLAGGWERTARLWNAHTGASEDPVLEHQSQVYTVNFSPDGRQIVTGSSDDVANVWRTATGELVGRPLQHFGGVRDAVFSPCGTMILTGSSDLSAKLWDAGTHEAIGPPLVHPDIVVAVVFSPDGRMIATACQDGITRLWQLPHPAERDTVQTRMWIESVTGLRLDRHGVEYVLGAKDVDAWRRCKAELAAGKSAPID